MLRAAIRLIDSSRPGVLHADLAACNDYLTAMEAAAKVTCPTLFLLGRGDKMTPVKVAQDLIGTIAGAEKEVIGSAGHMMMIEAPHDSRRALMRLVNTVAAGANAA